MAFAEDLSVFFNSAEFAVTGTLDGVAVTGIFDAAYEVATAGYPGLGTCQPSFQLPTASVPSSPVGKVFIQGAVTYAVAEHHPDGTGVSMLLLERTS